MSFGSTHFCHWFQPLTGASAEKHDAFTDWHSPGKVIEKFDGRQLLQGEPDASSFPSGGLRCTQDRTLSYMSDFEERALQLGIPLKIRHNEVAPSQYEVAPIFERASLAVDHNILLMELMRQTARKHGLACLLHEKPFAGLNGSGKHANWSINPAFAITVLNTILAFDQVLRPHELKSLQDVFTSAYVHHYHIEAKLMVKLFSTSVLPAAVKYESALAQSLNQVTEALGKDRSLAEPRHRLEELCQTLETTSFKVRGLKVAYEQAMTLELSSCAYCFCERVQPLMNELRLQVDLLEMQVDDMLWPWPKYRELLFLT